MNEQEIRKLITVLGKSLFDRRYTAGGSGNISVRIDDGILTTPTNSSMGRLDPDRISKLDPEGKHLSGDKPSKESRLHLAVYRSRPQAGAVVHLHSPYAVAVSCLEDIDSEDTIPPLTPYFVMRIGKLPLVPYFPPGDKGLVEAVAKVACEYKAVLMAHHGSIVTGQHLEDAVYSAEELEETARLFITLKQLNCRALNDQQVAELLRKIA